MTSIYPHHPLRPRPLHIASASPPTTLSKINLEILFRPTKTPLQKMGSGTLKAGKIVFFPITLLVHLIHQSLSKIASTHGLKGTTTKHVDFEKRNQLLAMGGENIQFGFKNGPALEGMFFHSKAKAHPQKTLLVCTGSHKSYENYAIPMVKALTEMGHNVMTFNYHGFGNSGGKVSEKGIYDSVEAAYQYLAQKRKLDDASIVAWGYSLGSGAVADLTKKHSMDIVIDRGFSSMSKVAAMQTPKYQKTAAKMIFTAGAHFDNVSKLKRFKGRAFVAQGKTDETMPQVKHGDLLNKALGKRAKVKVYETVDSPHHHQDVVWFGQKGTPDYQAIQKFLSSPL
jgi:hypothetical protein